MGSVDKFGIKVRREKWRKEVNVVAV